MGLWLLITSMKADVCDWDEWKTGFRREGMYGAAAGWFQKVTFDSGYILTNEETVLDADGLFIAIGHIPNTKLFEGKIEPDVQGYILTDRRHGSGKVYCRAGGVRGIDESTRLRNYESTKQHVIHRFAD